MFNEALAKITQEKWFYFEKRKASIKNGFSKVLGIKSFFGASKNILIKSKFYWSILLLRRVPSRRSESDSS